MPGENGLENRHHLVGRPGQQQHLAVPLVAVEAGGRAHRVGDHFGAFDDKGLAGVDLGHDHAAAAEELLQLGDDLFPENQLPLQGRGHRLAGDVILGRAQPAAEDDQLGALAGFFDDPGEVVHVVAHHHLHVHQDPLLAQAPGHVGGVGVDAVQVEQLAADGDEDGSHVHFLDDVYKWKTAPLSICRLYKKIPSPKISLSDPGPGNKPGRRNAMNKTAWPLSRSPPPCCSCARPCRRRWTT